MTNEDQYDDFLITPRPDGGTTVGVLEKEITVDFILDLYDKYREMPTGKVRDVFKESIKLFEQNMGKYLILTQSKN